MITFCSNQIDDKLETSKYGSFHIYVESWNVCVKFGNLPDFPRFFLCVLKDDIEGSKTCAGIPCSQNEAVLHLFSSFSKEIPNLGLSGRLKNVESAKNVPFLFNHGKKDAKRLCLVNKRY